MTKGQRHKMTFCMEHMHGEVDDPGAFCQWLRQQAARAGRSRNPKPNVFISKKRPKFVVRTTKGSTIWLYHGYEVEVVRGRRGWEAYVWIEDNIEAVGYGDTEQDALKDAKVWIDNADYVLDLEPMEQRKFRGSEEVIERAIDWTHEDGRPLTRAEVSRTVEYMRGTDKDDAKKLHYFYGKPLRDRLKWIDDTIQKKLPEFRQNPKQKGRKVARKKTSRRKKNPAPQRAGGRAFMSKSHTEQRRIVFAAARKHGYRSALGSVMLLQNINKGPARARVVELRKGLVREYTGAKIRNPAEGDTGSWDAIPEMFEGQLIQNPAKLELTDAQLDELDALTNPWPSTYGATYGAYRRHGMSKKKARPKARSRVAARSRAGERVKKQRRIMAGFLRGA